MTKLNKLYNYIIKAIIIVCSYSYIIYHVLTNQNYKQVVLYLNNINYKYTVLIFSTVLILMIINWFIESYKWKILIEKVEKVSFKKAISAILAGLSISTFTPNRIGEFLGRIMILKSKNRWKAIMISLICSMSQLLITFTLGVSVIYYFIKSLTIQINGISYLFLIVLYILLIISNIILLLIFFNVGFIGKLLRKVLNPKWKRIKTYLYVFTYFKRKELLKVMTLSFIRYLIFSTQYVILLYFFGIHLKLYEYYFVIILIYFTISAIPSYAIAELGIKGSVAVVIFNLYYENILQLHFNDSFSVIASTSILWLINIALPVFFGNLIVARLKIVNSK